MTMHKKLSLLVLLISTCLFSPAHAGGFAATVSPPRFELQGEPGKVIREIVEIHNTGDTKAVYSLRTADWKLSDDGGLTIYPPELQPDSCRPWVRMERLTLPLQARAGKRLRFEVHIPEGTPSGECRLAILVEPGDNTVTMARAKNIEFPIQGRIAIIIYVAVGDAKPVLTLQSVKLQDVHGRLTPVAVLKNTGNAHGRPSGFLDGRDASSTRIDFTVAETPIMPAQTREIPLWQAPAEGTEAVILQPPLQLEGTIEWRGGKQKFKTLLE
jgi:fimbrial chaperone protein